MVKSILFFSISITLHLAQAREIRFEGYYKILSKDQHIGFAISRYEFDAKANRFYSTQLTKIRNPGADIIESLSAVSEGDANMTPVSFKYTALVGKETKSIDAKFVKGKKPTDTVKMNATVVELLEKVNPKATSPGAKSPSGKTNSPPNSLMKSKLESKTTSIKNDLMPHVFLGTFLYYRMLRSETGIQTKSNYQYDAIAEEDGRIEKGSAVVIGEEKFKGFTAFRIENQFKKNLFITHVTDQGEALSSSVKDARLSMELVPTAGEAVGAIGLPESVVKSLFGEIPTGEKNVVARYFKNADQLKTPPGGKQEGFPAGQGVHIKNQVPTKKEGP